MEIFSIKNGKNFPVTRRKHYLLFSFLIPFISVTAQSLLFPTDYFFSVNAQKAILADTERVVYTCMQPYLYKELPVDTFKRMKAGIDPFFDKLHYEDLIRLRHVDKSSGYDRKFYLDINPVLNLTFGVDQKDTTHSAIQINTRGVWLKGELGKKFRFESMFIENQAFFPTYLKEYGKLTNIVPGQGRWKNFKTTGFDFASAYGVMNFDATKNLTIRLGHGKQKVGNGYRSLLLSDNSFNYPYLQFIVNLFKNKVQYSQTYALLMNLNDGGAKTPPGTESIFQKKAASFQQLSWHTGKYLDVYLFQGLIAQPTDKDNQMYLDPLYASPVIFSNVLSYGFNNTNHVLVGGGFDLRPCKKLEIYGQSMYDGAYKGKANWGLQGGIKYFDALGLRNLFMQVESNSIFNSYAPTLEQTSLYSYSHYNQSLLTPAIFPNEIIAMLSYSYRGLFIQLKQNFVHDAGSSGAVNFFDGKLGYMINPHYNLNVAAGITTRSYLSGAAGTAAQEMQMIYLTFRTSLYNLYYDF